MHDDLGGASRSRRTPARAGRALLLGLGLLLAACAPPPSLPSSTMSVDPTATSSAPTPSAAPQTPLEPDGGWPGPDNTGVPAGTRLSAWDGDCTITQPGTVIDARTVDCDLRIRAADVTITRSVINGNVSLRGSDAYSFTISDSEVHAGERMVTAIGNGNFTAERVEVTGGRRSVYCTSDCTLERSWVHAQASDPEGEAHMSGVRMGRNTTLRYNTIVCEGDRLPPASGCSAALTGYGDFGPIVNNLIEGNLFQSGTASFCAFGGSTKGKPHSDEARDIRFIRNVFQRDAEGSCGLFAPIEAFDSNAPGNVWEGNVWDDGAPLPPHN